MNTIATIVLIIAFVQLQQSLVESFAINGTDNYHVHNETLGNCSLDGHDHLNVTSNLIDIGNNRTRRDATADDQKAKFAKVMTLVQELNLTDCVARVICDLNCNPEGFGADGKKALETMLSLQTSGSIGEGDMRFYLESGLTGRKYRQAKTCELCITAYPNCKASSADLISVVSLIKLDQA